VAASHPGVRSGAKGPRSPWGKREASSPGGRKALEAVWGQLRGHRGGGIDLSFVRVADVHDRFLSRENKVLPTRATEERANTITAEFSARDLCLSARVPAFRRTRHPFAVSGHWCGLHRRLSLCSLPVSKQSGGSLGSFGSVAQLATCKTWQAAY
jgi:hypothetical protein